MPDPMLKLQILARAELALARIYARRAASRSVYILIALVCALFALGMLNYAAYLALATRYDPAVAALVVGVADGLLAAILVAVSGRAGVNHEEEKMAQEIRDLARAEIKSDIDGVRTELAQMRETVDGIREGVTLFSGSTVSSLLSVAPFLARVLKRFRKTKR